MTKQTAPKAPHRTIISPCIQDTALELLIDNSTPDQVANLLRAAWAVSGVNERFAILKSDDSLDALSVADTYESVGGDDISYGYIGCESDCYESHDDALLAALEESMSDLGLEAIQTPATEARDRFLELMKRLSDEGRTFHLDDSPESVVNVATGQRIFTDEECESIDSEMSAARAALGQDLMWELAWPFLNPDEDQSSPSA